MAFPHFEQYFVSGRIAGPGGTGAGATEGEGGWVIVAMRVRAISMLAAISGGMDVILPPDIEAELITERRPAMMKPIPVIATIVPTLHVPTGLKPQDVLLEPGLQFGRPIRPGRYTPKTVPWLDTK